MKLDELIEYETSQMSMDDIMTELGKMTIGEMTRHMSRSGLVTESTSPDTFQIDESFITDMFERLASKFAMILRRLKSHTKTQISQIRLDIMKAINPSNPESVSDQEILMFIMESADIHSAVIKMITAMKLGSVVGIGKVIVELILLHPAIKAAVSEFLKNLFANVVNSDEIKRLTVTPTAIPMLYNNEEV